MAAAEPTSPVAPRGTERTRRRAQQAAAVDQALVEAQVVPPQGDAQKVQIAENKARDIARFGGDGNTTRRKVLQAEHAKQALVQEAQLPYSAGSRPALVPGQQANLQTANRMAMAHDREERDVIYDAAKAAGVAVRDTLRDMPEVEQRYRKRDARNTAAEAAVKKE